MKNILYFIIIFILLNGCTKEERFADEVGNLLPEVEVPYDYRTKYLNKNYTLSCTFVDYYSGSSQNNSNTRNTRFELNPSDPNGLYIKFLYYNYFSMLYGSNGTTRKIQFSDTLGTFKLIPEKIDNWTARQRDWGKINKNKRITLKYKIEPSESGVDSTVCICS